MIGTPVSGALFMSGFVLSEVLRILGISLLLVALSILSSDGCVFREVATSEGSRTIVGREQWIVAVESQKCEQFVFDQKFILETDHSSLQFLQRAKHVNHRVMRWSLALQPYQFVVQAIPGKENIVADFMSRFGC